MAWESELDESEDVKGGGWIDELISIVVLGWWVCLSVFARATSVADRIHRLR